MPETLTKSLRIPQEVLKEIEHEFHGRDFSSIANELLAEGIKMRRCPGIVFSDSSSGFRTARVAGTGNDVWLIIAAFKAMEEDWARLKKAYHWLTEEQLRAAVNYYQCYPDEIDRRIQSSETITSETLYERYPFMRPHDEVLSRRRPKSNHRGNPSKTGSRRRQRPR